MALRVARGARGGWRDGRLQFRIQSTAAPELLRTVVNRIADDLIDPEPSDDDEYGPKFVSDLVVLPDGAAFWIDAPDASRAMVDRIVATIIEGLDVAGIDGRLSGAGPLPERAGGPQIQLAAVPRHPPARDANAVIPWDEVQRALDWVLEDPVAHVVVESGAVFVDLSHQAARDYVTYLHRGGRSCHVLAHSTAEQRECSLRHPADRRLGRDCPHLGLAWSGPEVEADIDAAFDATVDRARTIGDWAANVHVTVRPDAHDVLLVFPPWPYDPPGHDATIALDDHILDAFPWQRLTPDQARRLPNPLHRQVSFDEATGELRMGRLDHWLREPATARAGAFARTMRAFLGHALATRDIAWGRQQALPTSTPCPAAEPSVDEPQVDLDTVELTSHPRAHPSLGVTPLELLSLRRRQPFYDAVEISAPLRAWLDGLATPATLDPEPVRRAVDALAAADIGERHVLAHMDALADWLVGGRRRPRRGADLVNGAVSHGDMRRSSGRSR